mmetsp:Transcript_8822/g.34638  ORF Transcript_8822/g.34638 Transcript_8822/m.34638 type:complete len:238 (+) Transcript_8822:3054-3767(+)
MFLRLTRICSMSSSQCTVPGFSSVVAIISAHGPTAVLCPHAWYPAPGTRLGEHVSTNIWLSTALARCSSSQCSGPVTVLNAPGYTMICAPLFAHAIASSGNLTSKQIPTPSRPTAVSTTVSSAPGLSVSLSLNEISPGMSTSNRCVFLCLPSRHPSESNTQQVLYSAPVSAHRSGTLPPTTTTPSLSAESESIATDSASDPIPSPGADFSSPSSSFFVVRVPPPPVQRPGAGPMISA